MLAARLHSNRNYACCEEVHAGGEGQCEKDMIIAWVAGLDVGDTADRLQCSIQVYAKSIRETYQCLKIGDDF